MDVGASEGLGVADGAGVAEGVDVADEAIAEGVAGASIG